MPCSDHLIPGTFSSAPQLPGSVRLSSRTLLASCAPEVRECAADREVRAWGVSPDTAARPPSTVTVQTAEHGLVHFLRNARDPMFTKNLMILATKFKTTWAKPKVPHERGRQLLVRSPAPAVCGLQPARPPNRHVNYPGSAASAPPPDPVTISLLFPIPQGRLPASNRVLTRSDTAVFPEALYDYSRIFHSPQPR